jgi:hypothetical protein
LAWFLGARDTKRDTKAERALPAGAANAARGPGGWLDLDERQRNSNSNSACKKLRLGPNYIAAWAVNQPAIPRGVGKQFPKIGVDVAFALVLACAGLLLRLRLSVA